ncbi:MAG: hypothetical protein IPJ41_15430 [Phycisphaerales bacterium]|nr:hypothetical protein [Phycisphaerales bacterium]
MSGVRSGDRGERAGARAGTAWQRKPGVVGWARTNVALLVRPRTTMRAVVVERGRSISFARTNYLVGGAVLAAGLCVACLRFGWMLHRFLDASHHESWVARAGVMTLVFGIGWALGAAALRLLTWIEFLGIRAFGRVHRARITPTIATAITAHATAGWVVGAVMMLVGLVAGVWLHGVAMRQNVGGVRGALELAPAWIPLLSGLGAILVFDAIVYVGVRQCRFANRAREGGVEAPSPLRGSEG